MDIPVRQTNFSKLDEVDFNALEFGLYTSDHMLICDYEGDNEVNPGWQTPHILPYANLSLNPSTLALHYGQTVFEGMKAFRMDNGNINLFRLEKHYDRFTRSLHRMCMAVPPKDIFIEGLLKLVDTDKRWVPRRPGHSLYLRPFVYASEARFGVKVSSSYRFVIITGPVPELYSTPIKVKVETDFIRAARGGTGAAKCGGNYGASFYPTQLARQQGYDQLLWTDSKENKYIEESGMMNAMFVIDGKIVTPPLSDSILDGVTRDSLLTLAADLGYESEERPVSIEELYAAFMERRITAAFGAGTAAVVAPISVINIEGFDHYLPPYHDLSIHNQLKKRLEDIRRGRVEDIYGWNRIVESTN